MNQHGIRYIANEGNLDLTSEAFYAQKTRETYISAHRDSRSSTNKDQKPYTTSPARFGKAENVKHPDIPPPRAAPFQRSRNNSIDKKDIEKSEYQSPGKGNEDHRKQVLRFSQLRKKLDEEMHERERLQQLNACQQLKIGNLEEEINKLRVEKKQFEKTILALQKSVEENLSNFAKAQQNIEQLNRNLKEARMNQKSLNNLKNIQNQIDSLQEKNKKLVAENAELAKANKALKSDLDKFTKESTSESDNSSKGFSNIEKKCLGQLVATKTERERFLQANMHELQKKLYQKEHQLKKLLIQLNCIDRKKVLSIDQVKSKKDRQIKDLRQKFIKVTKDLKETKDKFEKNEKKKSLKDQAFLRKVKSSKNLGMASESQQVTFELSSEA